jgi:hypothetical protein
MRKIFLMIVITIFIAANSVQATMINILDVGGTISGASSLLGLEIYIGSLEREPLANANGVDFLPGDFNKLVRIQPNVGYYAPLKAMLERTFSPYMVPGTTNGVLIPDQSSEMNYMWGSNQLYGSVWFFGADTDGVFNGIRSANFNISPIPDLSPYIINDFFLNPIISQIGPNIVYDIPLYVDVTLAPVPEPSTLLLLCGGFAGLAFWSKRRSIPKLSD